MRQRWGLKELRAWMKKVDQAVRERQKVGDKIPEYPCMYCEVRVPIGAPLVSTLFDLVGSVNLDGFGAVGRGRLRFSSFDTDKSGPTTAVFWWRERPWNHVLREDGRWYEVRDANDQPMHPVRDFGQIPDAERAAVPA
jgi:hypothetical protein